MIKGFRWCESLAFYFVVSAFLVVLAGVLGDLGIFGVLEAVDLVFLVFFDSSSFLWKSNSTLPSIITREAEKLLPARETKPKSLRVLPCESSSRISEAEMPLPQRVKGARKSQPSE